MATMQVLEPPKKKKKILVLSFENPLNSSGFGAAYILAFLLTVHSPLIVARSSWQPATTPDHHAAINGWPPGLLNKNETLDCLLERSSPVVSKPRYHCSRPVEKLARWLGKITPALGCELNSGHLCWTRYRVKLETEPCEEK
ncbi:hypothetical protein IF1G_05174 [Cordyceps javanica]|uniref:Uncharacterized protein n=1 Tax=Cordyceps javanica TaxID=43265 RepID=A0A545V4G1_9HYPO|nr:hypothetical protein IF1G_05174 [Cordyceps javanica]